jgi:hypothetical protein
LVRCRTYIGRPTLITKEIHLFVTFLSKIQSNQKNAFIMDLRPFENISVSILAVLTSGIIVYYLKIKHKEKMELIKMRQISGNDNSFEQKKYSLLGNGILALSLAVSLFFGLILTIHFPGQPSLIIYLISILFFGGLGLIIYYLVIRKVLR